MKLSSMLYYGDFVAAPLSILGVAIVTVPDNWTDSAAWLVAAGIGFGFWTFLEYVVHAWVYHRLPGFKAVHDAHHDAPKALIGAPSFLITVLILLIAFAPFWWYGQPAGGGLASGLLSGYLAYMTIHHMSHHARPGWLFRGARMHHLAHHYRGGESHFGITTNFWDRVFSTDSQVNRGWRRA